MSVFLDHYITKVSSSIFEYPEALDYLHSRSLTDEDIRKYSIGYSTLITPKDDGSRDYSEMKKKSHDWLSVKGKIIFPVTSCNGVVVGMIARRLDQKDKPVDEKIPRYKHLMTSGAEAVGAFFGFPQASEHILKAGFAYVVEGTVDCISLAKVFPNCVSTLTSMVNSGQMWTLRMVGDCAVVVFDPDKAGLKGAQKALEDYGEKLIVVRDIGYGDPNKCLVEMGLSGFERYAKSRLRYVHFSKG